MSNYAKALAVIVVAASPLFAAAQRASGKPSPQQRAGGSASAETVAPAPQTASPDSRRFVTNENFFRAGARTQSTSAANPTQPAVTPSSPAAGVNRLNQIPVPAQPPMPQLAAPAIAGSISPGGTLPQPAVNTNSAPAARDHDTSAAVDYAAGQLTVIADRAPLGHVLKLIGGKTGAVIDVAPELQQEPVMAKLGPSPVQEVLTALLDSPRIDYIVFGSGDEPGGLQRIVVRRRQSFGNAGMGVMRSAQPQQEIGGGQSDANGKIISRTNIPGQNEMTQEQRMEEWKKQRAQMLEAEMKQAALDRENEKNHPPQQPEPQETPQQQDNPPQS
jgi:hypothetical protein